MAYTPESPEIYQGKQVIINSDRLLFNAKDDSILLFSDKAIGFSTNGSIHFDTSENDESKFIVNAPNIYLGLKFNGNLPTEPLLLGDTTGEFLIDMLDVIDGLIDDVIYKVSFITGAPGTPTAPNPANDGLLGTRRAEIVQLKNQIENIKSKISKSV